MDQVKVDGVQYRRVVRKCGKNGCKCNIPGQEHGPYWYAYDRLGPARYVGTDLPEHVKRFIGLLQKHKKQIKKIRAEIEKQREFLVKDLRRVEKELDALDALESGEYADRIALDALGLSEFVNNGKGE